MNLFIAGTDTGIGKTVVSAVLALKLGFDYWKPIQSGTEEITDSEWIAKYLGHSRVHQEVYRLLRPLSPHQSARLDGVAIDLDRILANCPAHSTIIEGAGGVLTPLHENALFADLIQRFGQPVILVAKTGLGTINHTLLSLEALRQRKIEPLGIVLVGERNIPNLQAIEFYGKTPVLGTIPMIPKFSREALERHGSELKVGAGLWNK